MPVDNPSPTLSTTVDDGKKSFASHLTAGNAGARSWREKLDLVHSLLADEPRALTQNDLADLAIYLRFLNTGEISCAEDGRHFRPSHHARLATQIHERLAGLMSKEPLTRPSATLSPSDGERDGVRGSPATGNAFLIRKILACLPSTAAPFQRAEPLTRIRDIAHRNDIPQDLKREIKTTLQNKLHRCAGPEDLVTSARLLERITAPGAQFSGDFVEQFRIFHGELTEFFNARSLAERLHALAPNTDEANLKLINEFLEAKQLPNTEAQSIALAKLTQLRQSLLETAATKTGAEHQELWLADIALENFAFTLLSEILNELEPGGVQTSHADVKSTPDPSQEGIALSGAGDATSPAASEPPGLVPLSGGVRGGSPRAESLTGISGILALTLTNLRLSQIATAEASAIEAELQAGLVQLTPDHRESLSRLKATVERARRLAGEFSDGVLAQLADRANTLGQALGVAPHAVKVFGEGEVRGHLVFQLAKLTSELLRQLREALGQSPWDVLVTGQAAGLLVSARTLGELGEFAEPLIVLLGEAEGDEEIPTGISGLLLAHELPHLSHLGVRARQAGVVVACCEEAALVEELRRWQDQRVTLHASSEGIQLTPNEASVKAAPLATPVPMTIPEVKLRAGTTVLPVEQIVPTTGGNKSDGARQLLELARRKEAGFSAPEGLVIPFGVMEECLRVDSRFHARYQALATHVNEHPASELAKATAEIRGLIAGVEVPDEIMQAVLGAFGATQRLAVRSSANSEDLPQMAGAGLHESVAGVTTESVAAAVKSVWASLWTERAAASRRQAGIPQEAAHMAVLIQPLIEPDLSFILHTVNPLNHSPRECYVELAVGLGETLASAAARGTPYRMLCDRETGAITLLAFASFSHALEVGAAGALVARRLDYSQIPFTTDAALRAKLGARLAKVASFVEREFGAPQDVEGVVRGDEIILVQSRAQQGIPLNREPLSIAGSDC